MNNEEFMQALSKAELWVAKNSVLKRGFSTYNETSLLVSQLDFVSECFKPLLYLFITIFVFYSTTTFALLMTSCTPIIFDANRKLELVSLVKQLYMIFGYLILTSFRRVSSGAAASYSFRRQYGYELCFNCQTYFS